MKHCNRKYYIPNPSAKRVIFGLLYCIVENNIMLYVYGGNCKISGKIYDYFEENILSNYIEIPECEAVLLL